MNAMNKVLGRTYSLKPRMVAVTDPVEIASIESNGWNDIIGGKDASGYWAYSWSVQRWREHQRSITMVEPLR